ncbi:hypothetical protein DFA_00686 [Cavenderia fasciculata]|uniref:DEP domain-containing protein n=1 Tax=Cavenderia fasciculata TaxID=261658 RepID=F4PT85_CACFS|nr:uncharacterized protein DFA_00686 [Cavenderia fasciculata]EGG20821.1 hypothetical protein DFA_00686 [Cavenderia fasciculata]|eukprot:XP_004358671.1 hypothetical protein DFA_00686 [Cavenderia fasciculata]
MKKDLKHQLHKEIFKTKIIKELIVLGKERKVIVQVDKAEAAAAAATGVYIETCFVGREAVSWLIDHHKEFKTRDEVKQYLSQLLKQIDRFKLAEYTGWWNMRDIFIFSCYCNQNQTNNNNNNNNHNHNHNNSSTNNLETIIETTTTAMDSPLKASGHHFKDDGSFYAFTDNNSNNNNNNTNNNPLGGSIPIGAGTNNNNNNSMSNSLETQLLVTPSSVFVNSSSANHNKYSKRGGANLNKDELFQLGLDLMHSEKGLKLQKRKKNFLAAPTSCFSGQQIIDWLSENLCISRKESLVVAYKLVNLNIFFETGINPNNNINNLDSGSGGNNSAGSSPTGSSTSISYSNNNTSTTTTTNINIRGGGSGNNIDTSSTSSLSASFGAMLSTTPSAVAFSLPHHHHTPQPSTSAHSGIRGSTSLMPPPSSSTTSTSLLSSSLKTSTSSFMPPPSSPLKSSSSTSFSNPNNHNSMSSNGFRLPVEDNPDVYYEFLTKPEAIISHVSMKRLSELHLAHKTLQSIPTTIINTLNYLKVLDFSYNALQDHSSLESVSTFNNNFVNIPTSQHVGQRHRVHPRVDPAPVQVACASRPAQQQDHQAAQRGWALGQAAHFGRVGLQQDC